MHQHKISAILIPLLLIPASLILAVHLFGSGGNQLGNTFMLLIVVGAAIGFFAPKAALFVFVVAQFYTDFLKRLLILGDALSQNDIIISLGMGPILIIMACVTCTVKGATGQIPFSVRHDLFFCLGCVGISLLGAVVGGSGKGFVGSRSFVEIGQGLLGSSMLGMTTFACFFLFRAREDAAALIKWLVLGGIPMAIYTIYQAAFGFAAWEKDYIQTGLSSVLYTFYIVSGDYDLMRPFSTLNTHISVGAVSGTLFLVSLLIMARKRTMFGQSYRGGGLYLLISLLYLASCIACKNRTTYFLPIFGLLALWFFSGGIRTVVFYAGLVGGFVWVVINSLWINDQILYWSSKFEATAIGQKFGTLGTYQDRLKGMISLSEGKYWTPFGLPPEERPFFHDQITEVLLTLGYVPLAAGTILLFSCLAWWHRRCLSAPTPEERRFLINLSAITLSIGACGVAYGNMIFVAPVNSLLGCLIGIGMATIRSRYTVVAAAPSSNAALETVTKPMTTQPAGHFSR